MNALTSNRSGIGKLLITAAALAMFSSPVLQAQQGPVSPSQPMGQPRSAGSSQDDENPDSRTNVIDRFNDSAGRATKNAGQSMSDTWITTKVKSQLLTDSSVKNSSIQATTKNGIVSLSGTAASTYIAQRAEEDARQVVGVKDVDTSALTIKR